MITNIFVFAKENNVFNLKSQMIGGISFPPDDNQLGDLDTVTKNMAGLGFSRTNDVQLGSEYYVTFQKPEADIDQLEIALAQFNWTYHLSKDETVKKNGKSQEENIIKLTLLNFKRRRSGLENYNTR